MSIDHLVVRTPHRTQLVNHLASRFGLNVLQGFRSGEKILSEGVRFRNGPFLDVFDWPANKPSFAPLVAVETNLAKAEEVARTLGLISRVHKRDDFDTEHRPPWSTLSFARGQGVISSIFIIEYETAAEAWQNEQFSGALYDRYRQRPGDLELAKITLSCIDISAARARIETISDCIMPAFNYKLSENGTDRVTSLDLRDTKGKLFSLSCSDFDRFKTI